MADHVRFVLTVALLAVTVSSALGSLPRKRFEYKLSFKGPHLVQKDGTIPFWEHGGHAIASDESVRITPSLRSKKGRIWAKNSNPNQHWEVEISFRVSGRGRIGADGLAFWYMEHRGTEGPVFGSNDKWKGLGVFFDSFDNDGQNNNPYVLAMINDGTREYDHESDGLHQQLGGCLRDFRNKPYPVRAKIEFFNNALTVFFHNGMSAKPEYELCMRAENVHLPSNGYFGVSAATGGLADDHDVQSFLTHSLTQASDQPGTPGISDEEKKKYEKEFDEYWEKLQKAKEDFKKEHPDKVKKEEYEEEEKYFESQNERELKQIFDGQTAIQHTIRELHRKLDEVIGRQERTLSQISLISQGGAVAVNPGQGDNTNRGGSAPLQIDTIKRHEVDAVMAHQRDVIQQIRDIRSVLNDVHSTANSINSRAGQVGGGGGAGYQDQEMKDGINTLRNDVKTILSKQAEAPNCPPVTQTSCVTTTYLMVMMIVQLLVLVGYAVYRSNKDAAAKKFY